MFSASVVLLIGQAVVKFFEWLCSLYNAWCVCCSSCALSFFWSPKLCFAVLSAAWLRSPKRCPDCLARGRLRGALVQALFVGDRINLFVASCILIMFVQLCCCVYVFSFGCIALLSKMLLIFLEFFAFPVFRVVFLVLIFGMHDDMRCNTMLCNALLCYAMLCYIIAKPCFLCWRTPIAIRDDIDFKTDSQLYVVAHALCIIAESKNSCAQHRLFQKKAFQNSFPKMVLQQNQLCARYQKLFAMLGWLTGIVTTIFLVAVQNQFQKKTLVFQTIVGTMHGCVLKLSLVSLASKRNF